MSNSKIPEGLKALFDPSLSVKIIEVAKKYNEPEGQPITRIPEYTTPGGPNAYHCSKISTSWTQGFFPGMIWLLLERQRLSESSIDPSYSSEEIEGLARRWQEGFKYLARPSINHDQGFRFQLSYGKDYELTGNEESKKVMIEASDSLDDRYSESAGCIRSWDSMRAKHTEKKYETDNMDEHYLVIIDNMMNLDMLYEATKLTGHERYAQIANSQAEKSATSHVRPDYTTYHVVNMDQNTGKPKELMTAQGYADESCWSRGQAWAIYGYSQYAQRTGRKEFLEICQKLSDKFLSLLPESGVPWWDFDAPKPCPYDASAGTVAACGLLRLSQLLKSTNLEKSQYYLERSHKLIEDILRECGTPAVTLKEGKVDFGKDGWETILKHSTINGNPQASRKLVDHGLVYADYYLMEYGNELLKLSMADQTAK